jgi:hypothetical protein
MLQLRTALRSGALGVRSSATWAASASTGNGPAVDQAASSAKGGWRRLLDEYSRATSWLASAGAPGARKDDEQFQGAPAGARGLHTGGLGGGLGGGWAAAAGGQLRRAGAC